MKYDNYLFDLYGTLVDIHTDEQHSEVWERLAVFYGYYGAKYKAEELEKSYFEIINRQEGVLKGDNHEMFPELQIEDVFMELFTQKGVNVQKELAVCAGQFFRILSTEYIRLYDGAVDLLQFLKEQGKKVYLLSNAQRIFTEYEMHTLGIASYFDDIFISSECRENKIMRYGSIVVAESGKLSEEE